MDDSLFLGVNFS